MTHQYSSPSSSYSSYAMGDMMVPPLWSNPDDQSGFRSIAVADSSKTCPNDQYCTQSVCSQSNSSYSGVAPNCVGKCVSGRCVKGHADKQGNVFTTPAKALYSSTQSGPNTYKFSNVSPKMTLALGSCQVKAMGSMAANSYAIHF